MAPSGLRGGQPGGGSVEEAPGHPHTGRSDPASQTRARWHHLKQTQSIPRAGSSAGLGGAWASAPLASLGSQCCWSGHPPLEAWPGAGKMATEALFGLALWPQWPLQEVVGRPPPEGRQPVLLGTSPPESHFPSSTRSGSLSTPQSQEDGTRKSGPLGAVVCEPGYLVPLPLSTTLRVPPTLYRVPLEASPWTPCLLRAMTPQPVPTFPDDTLLAWLPHQCPGHHAWAQCSHLHLCSAASRPQCPLQPCFPPGGVRGGCKIQQAVGPGLLQVTVQWQRKKCPVCLWDRPWRRDEEGWRARVCPHVHPCAPLW